MVVLSKWALYFICRREPKEIIAPDELAVAEG
jgi:hypothetical protein